MAGARDNSSTFIEKCGSVATTSLTAPKSGKVIRTYTDGDHFAIAQTATLELQSDKPIVGPQLLFSSSLVLSPFFSPDPFYLHPNKPLAILFTFYLMPNDDINNYFWPFG